MNSDVLLLISWDNEKEKMFIPGKIYEYFALKKPVLSIGYKEGSLKDLIEEIFDECKEYSKAAPKITDFLCDSCNTRFEKLKTLLVLKH